MANYKAAVAFKTWRHPVLLPGPFVLVRAVGPAVAKLQDVHAVTFYTCIHKAAGTSLGAQ